MSDDFLPFDNQPSNDPEVEEWAWWTLAVQHPELIGTEQLPIHEGHPQTGLYRVRRKGGQWETLQIFRDDTGRWQAERNGRRIDDPNWVNDLWLLACRNPVEEDAFERASKGEGWADEPPTAPGIGHNLANESDPLDVLRIEYLGEAEQAREFLKEPITTQAAADKCAIWAARLMEIGGKADTHHKREKQPSLDEGRRVDNKWRELREDAPALARALKKHNTAWLQELDRLENERVAKARAEAERLRREAEEAAKVAVSPQAVVDAGKKISEAQAVSRDAEYRPPSAGRTSQKTFLRTYTSAKITDWSALMAHLAEHAEVRALAQSLADKAAKGGNPFPGTEIFTEKRP